jgi:hypothetical protein
VRARSHFSASAVAAADRADRRAEDDRRPAGEGALRSTSGPFQLLLQGCRGEGLETTAHLVSAVWDPEITIFESENCNHGANSTIVCYTSVLEYVRNYAFYISMLLFHFYALLLN